MRIAFPEGNILEFHLSGAFIDCECGDTVGVAFQDFEELDIFWIIKAPPSASAPALVPPACVSPTSVNVQDIASLLPAAKVLDTGAY